MVCIFIRLHQEVSKMLNNPTDCSLVALFIVAQVVHVAGRVVDCAAQAEHSAEVIAL